MQLTFTLRSILRPMVVGILLTNLPPMASADTATAQPSEAVDPEPWQATPPAEIEAKLAEWLVATADDSREAAQRERAARLPLERLYSTADPLTAVVECVAIASPATADLMETVRNDPLAATGLDWLDSADIPYWMRHNVRLYVGRALVQARYYEQALEVLSGMAPADVFDPASLLFYRAIAQHQLVRVDEANLSLHALLDAEQPLPERYAQVARLMKSDIATVEADSLNHIARRMSDVERRLSLNQADDPTLEVERGILESLDKKIEQLEQQARQQQQQQSPGSAPSGQPMEESRIAEMKGEGKVDVKDIGQEADWGDLPPRERERVMQQIGRDFPGHYRDLVEEYLKRLATDERQESQP